MASVSVTLFPETIREDLMYGISVSDTAQVLGVGTS